MEKAFDEKSGFKEIDLWKKKLLDLGKRNNLINYKDSRSSTLEILSPFFCEAFERITTHSSTQVFDDKLKEIDFDDEEDFEEKKLDRQKYLARFKSKVSPSQLLLFNESLGCKRILKSLMKKASDSITERGVNILYAAFGFIEWKEEANSDQFFKAPVLMVPITLKNDAVNEPFYVCAFDDEITVNATLRYMLETQYGITLPEFSDQSIEEYFNEIEELVQNAGWSVLREARIATFTFNKLGMYLDLDKNAQKIAANANIAAITAAEVDEDLFISGEEPDDIGSAKDLFLKQHNVVDADFSQTEAIEYAMMGKSFVLQGPPGTGKSQTITNMIAELIFAGKKVLFVSEKMAALEVVYNNLKKAGLSDFCLELHSYKANKKDFIKDLHATLTTPKTVLGERAENNLTKVGETVKKLNAYDSALYKVYSPVNMSLYRLIGLCNHLLGRTKEVVFLIDDIETSGEKELAERCVLLKRYADFGRTVGYDYRRHPLYGLNVDDSSYAFGIRIEELLNKALSSAKSLSELTKSAEETYKIAVSTTQEAIDFVDFVNFCTENDLTDQKNLDAKKIKSIVGAIGELKALSDKIEKETAETESRYNPSIFNENIEYIYNEFISSGDTFFKRMFNKRYKEIDRRLSALRKNGKKVRYKEGIYDLKNIVDRKNDLAQFEELTKEKCLADLPQYDGIKTDWAKLKEKLSILLNFLNRPKLKSGDRLGYIELGSHDPRLLNKLSDAAHKALEDEEELSPCLDSKIIDMKSTATTEKVALYVRYLDNLKNLNLWVEFSKFYRELEKNKLSAFVDKVIENSFPLEEMDDQYKLCFYRQWIDHIFKTDTGIADYGRFVHENDISSFAVGDKTQLDISKAVINAELSKVRPDPMLQMAGSPASIIMREHEKKRKLKPIRTLMHEIPDFIQALKPCFLMSPLSVSTFLSENMQFDVTIFDEASQVFPEDAIVAIYRSKQLIVVGDSKQMPPTKFFMATDADDDEYSEEESDIDSYESILDLCSASFPTKSLLCHYRSRDEGLINFSNKNYYDYNLVTYPSVHENKEDLGVDFVYLPDGVMDSRTKINLKEAEKVVDLIFEHFKKHPTRSLGVVAFNIKQQDAILKLLDKRRSKDTSLEQFFKPDAEEPFFVKNLETVQGDERDTIIFSITYAKNDKGQFAMRFGPLNTAGGERRLNVAVTRAKLNVKVVSSIKAFDIDPARVTNEGPKLLREYLDYAENGMRAPERAKSVGEKEDYDSPFEKDVYEFLKSNGFDVATQVGCSKYRIDIGLKRTGTSDYVLAIECDGATYHLSRSARDRDRLRQSVLERMNWRYYRIWSTDWYKNNAVEKKLLLDACNSALESGTDEVPPSFGSEKLDISGIVDTAPVTTSTELFDDYSPYTGSFLGGTYYVAEEFTLAEGPVSVDYFLKRLAQSRGFDKVPPNTKSRFLGMLSAGHKGVYEDGFMYMKDQRNYAMRKDLGERLGDISYISDYEIRNGMYAAIERSLSCKKEDLFAFIRAKLGFARTGDKIARKFETAFEMLAPYISVDPSGNITVNKENKLEVIKRR